jgi:CBS domain-containing protein
MHSSTDQIAHDSGTSSPIVAATIAAPVRRTCSPFSTVTEVVLIFKEENCEMVPVVDEGKPVGMVTDRDVALAVVDVPALAEQPVSRIMTTGITTVATDAPVDQVIRTMTEANAYAAFMIDENGRLGGLISWPDLTGRIPPGFVNDLIEPEAPR